MIGEDEPIGRNFQARSDGRGQLVAGGRIPVQAILAALDATEESAAAKA